MAAKGIAPPATAKARAVEQLVKLAGRYGVRVAPGGAGDGSLAASRFGACVSVRAVGGAGTYRVWAIGHPPVAGWPADVETVATLGDEAAALTRISAVLDEQSRARRTVLANAAS